MELACTLGSHPLWVYQDSFLGFSIKHDFVAKRIFLPTPLKNYRCPQWENGETGGCNVVCYL